MSQTTKTTNERVEEALRRKYPVTVHFVPEEDAPGYYLAFLPDFGSSACSATGDSPTEAIACLETVKAAVIRHYVEVGRDLPKPSPSPAEQQELQQMPVRLPRDLHERLKAFARQEGQSLNAYVVRTLSEHIAIGAMEKTVETCLERLFGRFGCTAIEWQAETFVIPGAAFDVACSNNTFELHTPVPIVFGAEDADDIRLATPNVPPPRSWEQN